MLKILIADDDEIICRGLKAIIEKNTSDCKVVGEAFDGEEALEAIQKFKPDLLISDIKMPTMDGITLIRNIKKLNLNIRIIVLSGFDEYSYVRETLKNGVMDYLLKPVENNDIIELLNRAKDEIVIEERNRYEHKKINEIVVQSITVLQEKLLRDLIKGNSRELESYIDKTNDQELLKSTGFVFAKISVDNFYLLKKQEENDVNNYVIDRIRNSLMSLEYAKNNGEEIYTLLEEDGVCILFTTSIEDLSRFEQDVILIVENLSENIRVGSNYTITVGISKPFNSIQKTYISYHQAEYALQRKFYEGKNKIITYDQGKCIYSSIPEKLVGNKLENLVGAIEIGHVMKSKRVTEEILKTLSGANISPSDFRETLSDIINRVFVLCPEFKVISESYPDKYDIFYAINGIDTVAELSSYTVNTVCDIVEKINQEHSMKSKRIIEIAKEHIMKNYNEDISLKMVAEYVHLNSSYLSELFKNETGKNFTDFLAETRISAAKKLLADLGKKVYEIGQAVGYNDITTFNRAFKKITGISPAEYRNLLK